MREVEKKKWHEDIHLRHILFWYFYAWKAAAERLEQRTPLPFWLCMIVVLVLFSITIHALEYLSNLSSWLALLIFPVLGGSFCWTLKTIRDSARKEQT